MKALKRPLLCILLFTALCVITTLSYLYIINTTEHILDTVELVIRCYENGDFEQAGVHAERADEEWLEFRRRRFLIIDKDEAEEITATLSRMRYLTKVGEHTEHELLTECEAAKALIIHYRVKHKFNYRNIL